MVSITTLSLVLFTIAHVTQWEYLCALVVPLMWGVTLSFSSAILFDKTAYARIRRHRGWNMSTFVAGNVCLHFVPLMFPPPLERCITWWDGTYAATLHLTWGLYESGGTLVLDHVYVPMQPWMWRMGFVVSTVTDVILVPLAWFFFCHL